jgi:rhodanese-related sulfurtransferase
MADILDNIEIAPRDVQKILASGKEIMFIDVREPWEHQTASIEGATLIPLREVPGNLSVFERAEEIVLFCHHGMRSLDAAAWLRSQGVKCARSMAGGIDRWSVEVDPKVGRY